MADRANRVVVIENNVLDSMATNKDFLREFPSLRKILTNNKTAGLDCGSCSGSNAYSARAATYQLVKQALAGLAVSRKSLLKEMLDTDKIQIVYSGPDGKAIRLNF